MLFASFIQSAWIYFSKNIFKTCVNFFSFIASRPPLNILICELVDGISRAKKSYTNSQLENKSKKILCYCVSFSIFYINYKSFRQVIVNKALKENNQSVCFSKKRKRLVYQQVKDNKKVWQVKNMNVLILNLNNGFKNCFKKPQDWDISFSI